MSRNERIGTWEMAGIAVWVEKAPSDVGNCYVAMCKVPYQDRHLDTVECWFPHCRAYHGSIVMAAQALSSNLMETAFILGLATIGTDVQNKQAIAKIKALANELHSWSLDTGKALDRQFREVAA